MLLCGKNMGLKMTFCKDVIDKTTDVVSNWMEYANKAEISEKRAGVIESVLRNEG
jgi:hypothetical protein